MKRLFILIVSFFLLQFFNLDLFQSSRAGNFRDIPPGHPHELAVEYLSDQEIFQGQSNQDRFDPEGPLNRAEWSSILLRALKREGEGADKQNCFPDVHAEWFANAVCYGSEQGWVRGYKAGPESGKFIPWNPLSLAEITVILERVFDWRTNPGEFWYSSALEYARGANIIDKQFPFDHLMRRSEAAEVLFRALALKAYNSSYYDPFLGDLLVEGDQISGPIIPEGKALSNTTVTMSAFPNPPASKTVPQGSLYAPVMQVFLSPSEATTLQSVSINRIALGRSEDMSKARLMVNGKVVQERSILDFLDSATWTDLNIEIRPGAPILLEMNVDFKADARPGLEYQFELRPENLQFSKSQKIIGKKIQGIALQISSVKSSAITVSNHSTNIRKPFINSEGEIIGRFNISSIHDVLIRRVKLRNDGRLSNNRYKNITLSVGTTVLSRLETVQGKKFDFTVSDYLIEGGRERSFTIRADIDGGKRGDSIRFYLDEAEDIYAYDVEFNFGSRIINNFGNNSAFCAGVEDTQCPAEGMRQRCSKADKRAQIKGCVEEVDPTRRS